MKCLAVNTATSIFSLALVEDEKVLHIFETPETRDQGDLLLEHLQDALKKNDIGFAELDLLAVVTGPGSFTGIRVGLAAMRGIALAAEKPLIGMSSFDMFAVNDMDVLNIVAVESWRDELFFAVLDGEGSPLLACGNETPESFSRRFRDNLTDASRISISGDAGAAVRPLFPHAALTDKEANAEDVARLAMQKFRKGGIFARPVPYYLRAADTTVSAKISKTMKSVED
ncbi:MAG: tRNA (adenosine(37)-N6)-threonylcarbamoyltransferase complex dimerization subunit type 1 TsaB [Pseudomonadota bacterium]